MDETELKQNADFLDIALEELSDDPSTEDVESAREFIRDVRDSLLRECDPE